MDLWTTPPGSRGGLAASGGGCPQLHRRIISIKQRLFRSSIRAVPFRAATQQLALARAKASGLRSGQGQPLRRCPKGDISTWEDQGTFLLWVDTFACKLLGHMPVFVAQTPTKMNNDEHSSPTEDGSVAVRGLLYSVGYQPPATAPERKITPHEIMANYRSDGYIACSFGASAGQVRVMGSHIELVRPLPGAAFGGRIDFRDDGGAHALIERAAADPEALPHALAESSGLLLLQGMQAMADEPALLVTLSHIFGPEVEDYRHTLTPRTMVHATVPEIFVVSNIPPASRPPPRRPDPPLTADGKLPVQFPHRRGWHTDQSYRRPPPDISLFLAVDPVPQGQGQTLFADGTAAYEALPPELKARVDGLDGIHVIFIRLTRRSWPRR